MYFKKIDNQLIDELAIDSFYETLYAFMPGLTCGNDSKSQAYKSSIEFLKGQFASFFEFGVEYSCVESGVCFDYFRLKIKTIENKLLDLTNGISTHKGALFATSLMACAAGKLDALGIKFELEYLITTVADFVRYYSYKSFANINTKSTDLTFGEMLYKQTGNTSIRGSAEEGFRSVLTKGLEFLSSSCADSSKLTRLYLLLISIIDDSRIIVTHGTHVMSDIKRQSEQLFHNYSEEEAKKFDIFLLQNQIEPKAAMGMLTLCLFTQKILSLI